MTFSSKGYLEKKTGKWGVGRFKYLQALVTEFQDTSKHEFKLQVLANLANFAYDPVNYDYFRQLNILDLFLGKKTHMPWNECCLLSADVLAEEKDEKMIEFAMGGVCNCCLDKQNKAYLLKNECIDFTVKCLSRLQHSLPKPHYNSNYLPAVQVKRLCYLPLPHSCT